MTASRTTTTLRKEMNGYAYEIRQDGRLVASGWSQGTIKDAQKDVADSLRDLEARSVAAKAVAQ